MTKTEKNNGYVHLTSPSGVVDTRNSEWYREAIVKAEDAKYFKDA